MQTTNCPFYYDPNLGYYYDQSSGLNYDPKTRQYFVPQTEQNNSSMLSVKNPESNLKNPRYQSTLKKVHQRFDDTINDPYYYDSNSGCYYDQNSLNYDSNTQLYYDSNTQLYYDSNTQQYFLPQTQQYYGSSWKNNKSKNQLNQSTLEKLQHFEDTINGLIYTLENNKSTSLNFWRTQVTQASSLKRKINKIRQASQCEDPKFISLLKKTDKSFFQLKAKVNDTMQNFGNSFDNHNRYRSKSPALCKPLEKMFLKEEWENHRINLPTPTKSPTLSPEIKRIENLKINSPSLLKSHFSPPEVAVENKKPSLPFQLKDKMEITKRDQHGPVYYRILNSNAPIANYATSLVDIDKRTASREHMLLKMKFFAATCSFIENKKEQLRNIKFPITIEEKLFDAPKCYSIRSKKIKNFDASHISWIPKVCIKIFSLEERAWTTKRISKAVVRMDGKDFSLNKMLNLVQQAAKELNHVCELLELRHRPFIYELFEKIRIGEINAETAVGRLREEIRESLRLIENSMKIDDSKWVIPRTYCQSKKTQNFLEAIVLNLQENFTREQILNCCRGMLEGLR